MTFRVTKLTGLAPAEKKAAIAAALSKSKLNATAAAKALGVTRTHLQHVMAQVGLSVRDLQADAAAELAGE